MRDPKDKVVLITGASAGLGLALARELARLPGRLVLTARPESLWRFGNEGFSNDDTTWLCPLDVADAQQRREVIREIDQRWGGVDVLINNAGIAYRTVTEHIDDAAWSQIMEVNCRAPLALTQLVLPGMRARRSGHIINVSSVGGMMAMPTMALYSAAKFALEGATEALWYEVKPWKVHVSLIEPGFIHSESFRNTLFTQRGLRSLVDHQDPYHEHYHQMAGFIEKLMHRTIATPESVARKITRAIRSKHPPLRVYATPDAHWFALMRRLLPRGLYHAVLYRSLPHISWWGRQR